MKTSLVWEIGTDGQPHRLETALIDLEKHLEDWIDADPAIAADDIFIVGRQVYTGYQTAIDLLALDVDGNLVILELKRDKTLRDTVAQGIEYAEWCSHLTEQDILAYAVSRCGSEESFKQLFLAKLGVPFPAVLNEKQRVMVVAPEIPHRTARVIEYLEGRYGVPVNGVSFDVLTTGAGTKLLVRHHVIEDEAAASPPGGGGGGSSPQKRRTLDQFLEAAEENGVLPLFEHLLTMKDILPQAERFWRSYAMRRNTPDNKGLAAFTVYPTAETNPGFIHLLLSPPNIAAIYSLPDDAAVEFISYVLAAAEPGKSWTSWVGANFHTLQQVQEFDRRFRERATAVSNTQPHTT